MAPALARDISFALLLVGIATACVPHSQTTTSVGSPTSSPVAAQLTSGRASTAYPAPLLTQQARQATSLASVDAGRETAAAVGVVVPIQATDMVTYTNPVLGLSFPLSPGTTWVYDFVPYMPGLSDTEVMSATYIVTETVVSVTDTSAGSLAEVRREHRLAAADAEWANEDYRISPRAWFLVRGVDVYELRQPTDQSRLGEREAPLEYRFPLAVGASWCPHLGHPEHPGDRWTVVEQRALDTRIGRLESCFRLTGGYHTGWTSRWLCDGVGLVDERYDHNGTPFGIHKELRRFSPAHP